jgi:hypothetical protein
VKSACDANANDLDGLTHQEGARQLSLAERITFEDQTQELPDVERLYGADTRTRKRRSSLDHYVNQQTKRCSYPKQDVPCMRNSPNQRPHVEPIGIMGSSLQRHTHGQKYEPDKRNILTILEEQQQHQVSSASVLGFKGNESLNTSREGVVTEQDSRSDLVGRMAREINLTGPARTLVKPCDLEEPQEIQNETDGNPTPCPEPPEGRKPYIRIPPVNVEAKLEEQGLSKASSIRQQSWRNPVGTCAPVVPSFECRHSYAKYDNESVPILHSVHIYRQDSISLLNKPTTQLKQDALALLERGVKAKDLGRSSVAKQGPTKIIDDCDLYLREGKVYVGTERGLLLVTHYLHLAGVPDTTPVRFAGLKPLWAKALLAQRHARRIKTTTEDSEMIGKYTACPPVPSGDLGLEIGYVVEVYERHPTNGRAYGRRIDNGKVGWFDYAHTVSLDTPYPTWEDSDSPPRSPMTRCTTPKANVSNHVVGTRPVSLSPMVTRVRATPTSCKVSSPAKVCTALDTSPLPDTRGQQLRSAIEDSKDNANRLLTKIPEPANARSIEMVHGIGPPVPEQDTLKSAGKPSTSIASPTCQHSFVRSKIRSDEYPQQEDEIPNVQSNDVTVPPNTFPNLVVMASESRKIPDQRASYDDTAEDEVDWDDDPL